MDLPVADRWFRQQQVTADVTLLVEAHLDPFFESNVWHVRGRDRDLVVDTGNGIGDLKAELDPLVGSRPVVAIATHAHFDHVGGMSDFDERWCHPADADGLRDPFPLALLQEDFPPGLEDEIRWYGYEPAACVITALPAEGFDLVGWRTPAAQPTRLVGEGDVVDLGDRTFEVLHVPGHTPGSIALWDEANGMLFTGDTAALDDPLHADDEDAFLPSLRRLGELPARIVCPGHSRPFGAVELRALVDQEIGRRAEDPAMLRRSGP